MSLIKKRLWGWVVEKYQLTGVENDETLLAHGSCKLATRSEKRGNLG